MTTVYMDFESQGEVLDMLDQPRPSDAGTGSTNKYSNSEDWDLSLGWNGAMDAYTGGWSEGAQKAYDLAERIRPRPLEGRTHLVSNVAGGVPNIGAYLAGAPNAMYQISKKQATGRPYVHLYMPIGYMASVDAGTAFDRGCALVAVADALESVGCRVKITLTRSSFMDRRDTVRLTMRFMVKDYGDRLDVDQLIFTAAHPAMFRRLGFALQERSDDIDVRKASNAAPGYYFYGYSSDLMPEVDCESDARAVVVCFPRLTDNRGTPESFLRVMVNALPEELQTEIREDG